ncbi:cupin domain-containing protein [Candidatus Poribacteria bacterium]|nr:cupin domain-containing protein [Candidatus Poribacteria bacterium]
MQIKTLDKTKMQPAHEGTIFAQGAFGGSEIKATFGSAWGYLKPGMQQKPERAEMSKLYFIVEGKAEMTIEDEVSPLNKGDLLHIPAQALHSIKNPGPEDVVTFAIWWKPVEEK